MGSVKSNLVLDKELRHCSCPQGQMKGSCKHKHIVAVSKGLPSFDVLPTIRPQMRRIFMYLGIGKTFEMNWFLPLQAESATNEPDCGMVILPTYVVSNHNGPPSLFTVIVLLSLVCHGGCVGVG